VVVSIQGMRLRSLLEVIHRLDVLNIAFRYGYCILRCWKL
jgi:hypothetical protein